MENADADREPFQCTDVASYDHVHANCEAPSVWIESTVAKVKKKNKNK